MRVPRTPLAKEASRRRAGQYKWYGQAPTAQHPAASGVSRQPSRASPGGSRRRRGARALGSASEPLRLGQGLELLEGVVLDLADALARDAEGRAHLLERVRLLDAQAVAELDHESFPLRQRVERLLDVVAPERERGGVERRLRLLVGGEVAEGGLLVIADRLVE